MEGLEQISSDPHCGRNRDTRLETRLETCSFLKPFFSKYLPSIPSVPDWEKAGEKAGRGHHYTRQAAWTFKELDRRLFSAEGQEVGTAGSP